MIERLKRLTDFQETILVIAIALGLFIYSSIHGLILILNGTEGAKPYVLNERGSIVILVVEVVSLGLIGYILTVRNWKYSDLNLKISFKIFLEAILIIIVCLVIGGLVYSLLTLTILTDIESVSRLQYIPHTNYLIWGFVLVINSVFEEFIYVGYLFKKFERHNRGFFILVSAILRTIIHLYQGLLAVISHFITGLVFGAYYSKYRRLTTLIIAHALFNLLVLWRAS